MLAIEGSRAISRSLRAIPQPLRPGRRVLVLIDVGRGCKFGGVVAHRLRGSGGAVHNRLGRSRVAGLRSQIDHGSHNEERVESESKFESIHLYSLFTCILYSNSMKRSVVPPAAFERAESSLVAAVKLNAPETPCAGMPQMRPFKG